MLTFSQIAKALHKELQGMTLDQIRETSHTSGTRLNKLSRLISVYEKAQLSKAAKDAGLIGVGLISYAEHRANVFARRIKFEL